MDQNSAGPRGETYPPHQLPQHTQLGGWNNNNLIDYQQVHQMMPGEQTQMEKGSNRKPKKSLTLWKLEVLSLILCVAMLVIAFVTLSRFNGRDLSSWPLALNITTMVAIYAALLRALLLLPVAEVISQYKWLWFRDPKPLIDLDKFDHASRGIWGSAVLLTMFSRPRFVMLGATLSIISLAIGPFAQQAVKITLCERKVDNLVGTIPISFDLPRDFFRIGAGLYELSSETSGAVLNGLLYPDEKQAPLSNAVKCPKGNCSFPAVGGISYSSMGVCTKCTDITPFVSSLGMTNDSTSRLMFGFPGGTTIIPGTEGIQFASTASPIRSADISTGSYPFTNITIITSTFANCSNIPPGFPNTVTSGITCLNNPPNLRDLGDRVNVVAVNCSFSICLKNYHGEIRNARLTEEVVSTVDAGHDVLPGPDPNQPFLGNYTAVKQPCVLDGKAYDFSNFSSVSSDAHTLVSVSHEGATVMVPRECIYGVSNLWVGALRARIFDVVAGNCSYSSLQGPNLICTNNNWWLTKLFNTWNASAETLSQSFESMATSTTNHMRAFESTLVEGKVLETTICIDIEWAWLSLPVAVVALSTIFLAFGMWEFAKSKLPVWKSSMLPLLFFGPSNMSDTRLSHPEHLGELETRAKSIKGQLSKPESTGISFDIQGPEADPLMRRWGWGQEAGRQ